MRRSKYGVRTDKAGKEARTVDNICFDSLKEAARYKDLKLLQVAGKISGLVLQRVYKLVINGRAVGSYRCDFVYFDEEKKEQVVEDVKGVKTPVYRLKKKLMKAIHGIEIQEV